MKKFLLMFLLACGATAMANTTDPIQEKKFNASTVHSTKETVKASKATAATLKAETIKEDHASHIVADNSRYGLGTYIVEFINRNNVKIMKRLLID